MVITPISLKSLSTLSVVISAARQPDSPSSHRRSGWSWSPAGEEEEEEEGADPSGRGGVGRSWVTQLLRRNVTAARALRTAAAASSAGGTRGEMLGWRWTEQWDRAAVFFLFCYFLFFFRKNDLSNKHKVRELSAAGLQVVPTQKRGHRSAASNSVRLPGPARSRSRDCTVSAEKVE